jgi:hypothetical protein
MLPGCLWLGYVAWRTGSILPGIVLHAGTNAGVQALVRFAPLEGGGTPFAPTTLERAGTGAVAVASGALAAWLLLRVHRWTRVSPPPSAGTAPTANPRDTERTPDR